MESQKINNLINEDKYSKYQTKKYYVINDLSKGTYNNSQNIRYLTTSLKSHLCDYSDAFIIVEGTVRASVTDNTNDTNVNFGNAIVHAFKNCSLFRAATIEINNVQVDNNKNLNIVMPMCNLIEYSNNYSDSVGSLYDFKRDETTDITANISVNNSSSFEYKSNNKEIKK